MKSRNKRFLPLLITVSAALVSGCWDRIEINDMAFVMANAFDWEKDNKLRETVLIALPGQMGGSGGGGGGTSGNKTYYIDAASGTSVLDTSNHLQRRMARRLNFSHRRVTVIGQDLARKGIHPVFDILSRFPQNRISTYFVIAEDKGEDLLKAQPRLERFSAEAIREILVMNPGGRVNLNEIWQKLSDPGIDAVIPIFTTVKSKGITPKDEVERVGIALFSGDRMVGRITGYGTSALLILTGRFQPFTEIIPMEKGVVGLHVDKMNKSVKLEKNTPPFRFRIKVKLEGKMMESTNLSNYQNKKQLQKLEQKWKDVTTKRIYNTISLMKKWKSDAMGAGYFIFLHHPAEWRKVESRWYEEFAASQFDIEVETILHTVGQISQNVTHWHERGGR